MRISDWSSDVCSSDLPEAPTSWAALWDPANEDKLGLLALVSNSFLLEVTAKTFMGGTDALDSEEGQLKAFDKRSEEHTSELQSLMRISYAVFCLKKKKKTK